jgi:CRP/FNR family cyclic AMP-dependent transcriptional regulator
MYCMAFLVRVLPTKPFIISSIPDTALIPSTAHYRAGWKYSEPVHNPVPRSENRAMRTTSKPPPGGQNASSIRSSPSRGVTARVRRFPPIANSRPPAFDVQRFLDSAGLGRRVAKFRGKETVFAQGDQASNVMYIHEGGVKLTVVNETGKEAVVAILGPGDFFGEGCLAGQSIRMGTATTIAPTSVLFIEKNEAIRVLHEERKFSDRFIAYTLARNARVEEDLVDQLFNSSEKRLARTLLLLARYGAQNEPQKVIPKVSQETLAEMIGTTRSRVNFFMNKFRKLGFIQYDGEIHVDKSLLSVVLCE